MSELVELIQEWSKLEPLHYTTSQILPTILNAVEEKNWRVRVQNHANGWQVEVIEGSNLQKHFTATGETPTIAALNAYLLCLKDGQIENP